MENWIKLAYIISGRNLIFNRVMAEKYYFINQNIFIHSKKELYSHDNVYKIEKYLVK